MNRATIRTLVLDRLDDPSSRRHNTTRLNRWINESIRMVARSTESLRSSTTIPSIIDIGEYLLPQRLTRINRVEFTPTADNRTISLTFRDFNSMDEVWGDRRDRAGNPSYYTTWGQPPALRLVLYPAPSEAGSITVNYYEIPADLSLDQTDDATEIQIVAGWEDLVVDYTEYLALRADANPRWQEAKQAFIESLAAMIDSTTRFNDQPGQISFATDPMYGGTPSWLTGGGDYY